MNRVEAQKAGKRWYVSTKACPKGHFERYVKKNDCRVCSQKRSQNERRKVGHAAAEKAHRRARPHSVLVREAKIRATARSLPFDLNSRDLVVPTHCPALGIPLSVGDGKLHDGSPTLDRLRPELGYVRGNVNVISHRANRIKNNATPAELRAVAAWLEGALK